MVWGDRVVTAPASQPITLSEVKRYLRIDDSDSDIDLAWMIEAAVDRIQVRTNRQLITARRVFTIDDFPCSDVIRIPYAPLVEVHSITYTDSAGEINFVDPDVYRVDCNALPGRLQAINTTWPIIFCPVVGSVEIEYTCGMADAAEDIPADLRRAIALAVQ